MRSYRVGTPPRHPAPVCTVCSASRELRCSSRFAGLTAGSRSRAPYGEHRLQRARGAAGVRHEQPGRRSHDHPKVLPTAQKHHPRDVAAPAAATRRTSTDILDKDHPAHTTETDRAGEARGDSGRAIGRAKARHVIQSHHQPTKTPAASCRKSQTRKRTRLGGYKRPAEAGRRRCCASTPQSSVEAPPAPGVPRTRGL